MGRVLPSTLLDREGAYIRAGTDGRVRACVRAVRALQGYGHTCDARSRVGNHLPPELIFVTHIDILMFQGGDAFDNQLSNNNY